MSAQRVLLWRHGRTEYNALGRFQGQTDVPLDEVGLGQAKRTADVLASLLAGDPVRIVSSDLVRASSTAQALADRLGVPVTLDPRLREINAGAWEGLVREEIVAGWGADWNSWRRGDVDLLIGGGESRNQAAARAAEAIVAADEAMDAGTLVCVSHGAALRGAILLLIGAQSWPWSGLESLGNARWAQLQRLTRGWRLSAYNVGP